MTLTEVNLVRKYTKELLDKVEERVEKLVEQKIKEIDNELKKTLKNVDIRGWRRAIDNLLTKLSEIEVYLQEDKNAPEFEKHIKELIGLMTTENTTFNYIIKRIDRENKDLNEIYCENFDDTADLFVEDLSDKFYTYLSKKKDKDYVAVENFLTEKEKRVNPNPSNVMFNFIVSNIEKTLDDLRSLIINKLSIRCAELDNEFMELANEIKVERSEKIIRINQLVVDIVIESSLKLYRKTNSFISLVDKLKEYYNIEIVVEEEQTQLIDDELLAQVMAECSSANPNRDILVEAGRALNPNKNFDTLSTKELCNYLSLHLEVPF